MSAIFRILAALALLCGTACSSSAPPRSPSGLGLPPRTITPAPTVDPSRASFELTISSQSFREQRVTIEVTIDGRTTVAQEFDVQ